MICMCINLCVNAQRLEAPDFQIAGVLVVVNYLMRVLGIECWTSGISSSSAL